MRLDLGFEWHAGDEKICNWSHDGIDEWRKFDGGSRAIRGRDGARATSAMCIRWCRERGYWRPGECEFHWNEYVGRGQFEPGVDQLVRGPRAKPWRGGRESFWIDDSMDAWADGRGLAFDANRVSGSIERRRCMFDVR